MGKILLSFCVCFIFCLTSAGAFAADLTGREIMEKQEAALRVQSDHSTTVMLLVDKKGNKKKRTTKSWSKTMADGLTRSVMVFTAPADIAGTALMTWELADGGSKQWLYLPSTGKMQRISGQSKTSSFMGTDYTYEDLTADDVNDYTYTRLADTEIEGQSYYVVEAVPATKEKLRGSGYSKRILTIQKVFFYTVETKFFDRKGRPVKELVAKDLEQLPSGIMTAKKVLMVNSKTKHKTLMGLAGREVNTEISDEIFTERALTSGMLLD